MSSSLIEAVKSLPDPVTKRYHVAMVPPPAGPCWNWSFGGINFPVTNSTFDDQGNEQRRDGCVVKLDTDQIKAILASIKRHVVRWVKHPKTNAVLRAEILDVEVRGYRREAGDEPIARFIRFEPAGEEFVQPVAPSSVIEAMEKAVAEAQHAEDKAIQEPRDIATREKHGAYRKAGAKLPSDEV